jgi:diguanylate cyclase (GGDEF)-like protein
MQRAETAATMAAATTALALDASRIAASGAGAIEVALVPLLGVCATLPAVARVRSARAARAEAIAARVDELTGLPNGLRLRTDVAELVRDTPEGPVTLVVADLVGFKKYNDAYGFACGDALLRRLGRRLTDAVGGRGTVYRLRGAQFAFVTRGDADEVRALRDVAAASLFEIGEGFMIRCALGAATIPADAADVSEALRRADQEVQGQRAALQRQGVDESAIHPSGQRAVRVSPSPYDVTELSVAVGHGFGLDATELETLEAAASLRDVGMMSVPDAVVHAPGRLTDEDWRFVQLHTLVGERLLRSNFGMDSVADVVRASHERWDGSGYPDGRAGEEIPLASRIVFVCSAFQDMTTQRSHRPALTALQAISELERCSATQFDPAVVAAFVGAFSDHADAEDAISVL